MTPFVLLLTLLGAAAPTAEQLDEAALQLGDPDPRVRERAAATLKSAGVAAEKALSAVAESGDPEAARRARVILRQIQQPEIEELPPESDPPEVARYQTADRDAKLQIINQLAGGGSGPRLRAFVRLWKQEEEPEFRAAIYRVMLQSPGAHAQAMVSMGDMPAAERLLEAAMTEGNADQAPAAYAALCLVRGKLDEVIARWAARQRKPDGTADTLAANVLARLHRAAGNAKAAVEAARVAGNPLLLEEALLDAGDWRGLADAVATRAAPIEQPKQLGLLAAAQYMAGDTKGLDDTFERMRKLATPETLDDVAHILMLCGRTQDGMRLLTDANLHVERFKLLVAQERLDEAWALVASQEKEKGETAVRLRVQAARQLDYLGEQKRAMELLARVADENFGPRSAEVDALLGEAYRAAEQREKSWEHFRAALKSENAPDGESRIAWRAFNAGDEDGGGNAEFNGQGLWKLVEARFAAESLDQRFDRARGIVDKTVTLDEFRKLFEGAPGGEDRRGRRGRDRDHRRIAEWGYSFQLVRAAGQWMYNAGDREGAARYLADAADSAPSPEQAFDLYLRLGEWAADQRDWGTAAKWYGRASAVDRTAPGPMYLRAWALGEAGWRLRSEELMNLAHATPLAESWKRNAAIAMLRARRIEAPVSREVSTVLRTTHPNHLPADLAQRYTADQAVRSGDFLAAAAWLERASVNIMAAYELVDPVAYLRMPHTVRRHRAQGLIVKGDIDAAEREIAAARAMLPGDITLAIDVVPEFERRGNKARADELYNESMRAQDVALAKYPNSANHHNNAAWLAVNCGRDADKALAHARRAVELQPKNAAYVDTLAEVQFRRGEIDAAIATMNRCVELQPRNPRHREQLDRFEAAKRGEQRAMPPG